MYHKLVVRNISQLKINPLIKILILSDFLLWSANNLVAPIFAIFIVEQIPGAGAVEAGIAATIFMLIKSTCQIPISIYIDKTKSERDDFYTMFWGSLLTGFIFFLYPLVHTASILYLVQAVFAIVAALSYPGWMSIFTHHLDKNKTAYEWSLYELLIGVGMASTATIGGFAVERYGFSILFYVAGTVTLLGSLCLLVIKKEIYKK